MVLSCRDLACLGPLIHIGGILCCRGFPNPRRIKSGFVIRTKRNQKVKIKGITNPQLISCGFGDPQEHKHYLFLRNWTSQFPTTCESEGMFIFCNLSCRDISCRDLACLGPFTHTSGIFLLSGISESPTI